MNAKKLLISSALVASLSIGAVAALAQDNSGSTTPASPPALGMQGQFGQGQFGPMGRGFGFQNPDGPMMGQGQFGPMGRGGQGQFGPGGRGGRFGNGLQMGTEMMDLAMQYTGLSLTDLHQSLRDGKTLADLIEANGQSVDAFVADAVSAISANIDARVASVQAQADALKSTLSDRITAQVNGEQSQPPATPSASTPSASS